MADFLSAAAQHDHFIFGIKAAGIVYEPGAPPLTTLPEGVIGIHGYPNRLLKNVACCTRYGGKDTTAIFII
jgi:hypothetical protein